MAKMKLLDALNKLLAGKLDEEVDIDLDSDNKEEKGDSDNIDESTKDNNLEVEKVNSEEEKNIDNTSEEKDDKIEKNNETEVKEMADMKIFEDGWFDEASGSVNLEKIKNPEALAAIQLLTNKYKA